MIDTNANDTKPELGNRSVQCTYEILGVVDTIQASGKQEAFCFEPTWRTNAYSGWEFFETDKDISLMIQEYVAAGGLSYLR